MSIRLSVHTVVMFSHRICVPDLASWNLSRTILGLNKHAEHRLRWLSFFAPAMPTDRPARVCLARKQPIARMLPEKHGISLQYTVMVFSHLLPSLGERFSLLHAKIKNAMLMTKICICIISHFRIYIRVDFIHAADLPSPVAAGSRARLDHGPGSSINLSPSHLIFIIFIIINVSCTSFLPLHP